LDRETFIEAAIASIPAYLLSITMLGSEPLFGGVTNTPAPTLLEIGLSIFLGVICGVYAVFFTKTFLWTENNAAKFKHKIGSTGLILLAAAVLSVCGAVSFYSVGVGLHFIHAVMNGASLSTTVAVTVALLKTLATSVTLNFGGSGGLFFPTMVIGAAIGYVFSVIFDANYLVTFIAVGMAALIAGTHKVLLMPVAFIVESLGGAFAIPALLASGVSYLISGKHSFYPIQPQTKLKTEELALERFFLKGKKLIPEKLQQTKAVDVMTKNPMVLPQEITVKEALETFEKTNLRVLPVVDDQHHVVGVIYLEDLGYVDLRRQDMDLSEAALHSPTVIPEEKNIEQTAQLMMETQQDHIFVVDKEEKVVGVISGIDIVKKNSGIAVNVK
jgi:CIC family chloride channel protein